jgi:hypothetical protein
MRGPERVRRRAGSAKTIPRDALRSIELSGASNGLAEELAGRERPRTAIFIEVADDLVGVEDHRAHSRAHRRDGGLAGCQAAGEADS